MGEKGKIIFSLWVMLRPGPIAGLDSAILDDSVTY
jgi:hypothetical protein